MLQDTFQGFRRDQRGVTAQDKCAAHAAFQKMGCLHDGMPGPELLFLQNKRHCLAQGGPDLLLAMTYDVDLFIRPRLAQHITNPADQRFAGRLLNDLRVSGLHPFAFTGSHDYCTDIHLLFFLH